MKLKTLTGSIFILIGLGAGFVAASIYMRDEYYFEWDALQLPLTVAIVFTVIGVGLILESRKCGGK